MGEHAGRRGAGRKGTDPSLFVGGHHPDTTGPPWEPSPVGWVRVRVEMTSGDRNWGEGKSQAY